MTRSTALWKQGKSPHFEDTPVYRRVFLLVYQRQGHDPPRALVPRIKLQGPKITRNLTTDWYAHRVMAASSSV